MTGTKGHWAIALHGGAGVHEGRSYRDAEACLAQTARIAASGLRNGRRALDVVEEAVATLEASGLFVAGRGSAPNGLGQVELDAALMDGTAGRAGAVAALQGFASPIRAARRVMDHGQSVLLAGEGARRFADEIGLETVTDLAGWLRHPDGFEPGDVDDGHGTVGAAALDMEGRLAAATSTGGLYGAPPGRVGDSPIVGAGLWADENIAISCTGVGEAFLRTAAAHDLAARIRYAREDPHDAAQAVLTAVARIGGDGGLIAVTRCATIIAAFDTPGMKRAWVSSREPLQVGAIGREPCPRR